MENWPKELKKLSREQEFIRNDFMNYWHHVLPKKYGVIEKFNHGYPAKSSKYIKGKTLEIGSGLGEHILYEDLIGIEYFALEIRKKMANEIRKRFPNVNIIVQDCQDSLPFNDSYFDRILSINVFEHLPNLPSALKEIYRVLKLEGILVCVIPCEGGFLYNFARKISAKRIFEKRYKQKYDWFIESEHINKPIEIIEELNIYFRIIEKKFFPTFINSINLNLMIGLTLKKKEKL